uniref:Uncharacterized protein n=1 Tax=Ananas comosus var. bracteatus TaxID=296719 RepID=A0A6V7P4Z6_ANACO|nr:unnamed protein product [Ananas comosus var. bracteatus]
MQQDWITRHPTRFQLVTTTKKDGKVEADEMHGAARATHVTSAATLGLHSAHCGTGDRSMAVPVQILYRYTLMVVPVHMCRISNPRLGFAFFVGFVPVHLPVYRYTLPDCELLVFRGCFLNCSNTTYPHAP